MSRKENKLKGAAAATHQTYRRQSLTHFEDPTVEREVNYILEEQESLAIKFEHEESKSGKWILFVEHASMFSMWKKSCNLYSQGKLEGVTSLKASTAKDNSRTIVDAYGVIMFHCGPCDDKNLMMHYGKNIVELLSYFNKRGYIP
ncbi:uncharacterized protein LOC108670719 [Hyalella azteca]|uniref:Uncharacterized protein LOC108670719 n=1 Tax=Hyalella azteca TaxID=294128 RepID=A0A8B7NJ78_HYAAZ|nr:uncharacterized protein LOC108670719 [Hyalella azteca]